MFMMTLMATSASSEFYPTTYQSVVMYAQGSSTTKVNNLGSIHSILVGLGGLSGLQRENEHQTERVMRILGRTRSWEEGVFITNYIAIA